MIDNGAVRRPSRSLVAATCALVALSIAPARAAAVNDPVFTQGLQWGLELIDAPPAWSKGTGQGVTIAIVDSGAELQHEDLRDQIVGQVSCIGAAGDPDECAGSAQDDNGHGTHVAGVAAAQTNNGRGVAGVAPDAGLLIVRALEHDCSGDSCTATGASSDVSAAIRWAADEGADVINLSLGGGEVQSTLGCSFCDAIEYAWSQGAIAVVAAGNDTDLPSGFSNEHAVVVTATTRDDTKASYSNTSSGIVRSARWPVAAPGGEAESNPADCGTGGKPKGVVSTYWVADQSNQYACLAGTSMAAPHVSGALAVLLSTGRSPQSAIDQLLATAKDLGPPGRDATFGFGRIDLAKATGATPTPTSTPPTTQPPTTATSQPDTITKKAPSTSTPGAPAPGSGGKAPIVTTPETSAAAPLDLEPLVREPPGWLVTTAVAGIVVSGLGTMATAFRLLRRSG